jgi:hypothetical protein
VRLGASVGAFTEAIPLSSSSSARKVDIPGVSELDNPYRVPWLIRTASSKVENRIPLRTGPKISSGATR